MSAVAQGSPQLIHRSTPDLVARRILRVPDVRPPARSEEAAQKLFSAAMLISATRCLLGYVIFPFAIPALGVAGSIGPYIGLPLGVVALVFDVRGMRRFFVADHKWRWYMAGIYLSVMVLVTILLVRDIAHLL